MTDEAMKRAFRAFWTSVHTLTDVSQEEAFEAGWNACKAHHYAEVHELREALKECVDILELEIWHRYEDTDSMDGNIYFAPDIYPDARERFERDMVPIRNARAVLAKGDDNAG